MIIAVLRKEKIMDDLVNREFAMEKARNKYHLGILSKEKSDLIINFIGGLRTIVPRQGHWIENSVNGWICSECGYGVNPWNNTKFCPNCGAKMGEEDI